MNDTQQSVTETEAPPESRGFDALPLGKQVRRALDEMGYAEPTSVQSATYGPAVEGRDIIVQSQTGTGKTTAFGLPLVDRLVSDAACSQALILVPTRELALQNADELSRLSQQLSIGVSAIYGGAAMQPQIDQLRRGTQIVCGTPGRVLDHLKRGTLDVTGLRVLVLDEVDEMLSMGFARELGAILERLPPKRQTMCFSATVDDDVRRIAQRHMHEPEFIGLSSDAVAAAKIAHYAFMVPGKDRTRD
ncbi:MAG: DEAD/DEAH box helicase, partial [Proteobacteria bacterium]|nr:DEAD/DEAH box helicase [Pseudomonadota bacterium]